MKLVPRNVKETGPISEQDNHSDQSMLKTLIAEKQQTDGIPWKARN